MAVSKRDRNVAIIAVVGWFAFMIAYQAVVEGDLPTEPVPTTVTPSEPSDDREACTTSCGGGEDTEDTDGDNFIGGIDSEEKDRDRHKWRVGGGTVNNYDRDRHRHYGGGGGGGYDGYTGERCYAPGGETYVPC